MFVAFALQILETQVFKDLNDFYTSTNELVDNLRDDRVPEPPRPSFFERLFGKRQPRTNNASSTSSGSNKANASASGSDSTKTHLASSSNSAAAKANVTLESNVSANTFGSSKQSVVSQSTGPSARHVNSSDTNSRQNGSGHS